MRNRDNPGKLLRVTQSNGEGGVLRLRYQNTAGQTVGTARLLGTTIGNIEVKPSQRRKGYGQAILQDLIARGGRALIAVTEESRRLAERGGLICGAASGFHMLRKVGAPDPHSYINLECPVRNRRQ